MKLQDCFSYNCRCVCTSDNTCPSEFLHVKLSYNTGWSDLVSGLTVKHRTVGDIEWDENSIKVAGLARLDDFRFGSSDREWAFRVFSKVWSKSLITLPMGVLKFEVDSN